MTQEFRIWKPEHDGHAPPNWREGMSRNFMSLTRGAWLAVSSYDKLWSKQHQYQVPVEALDSSNDDAETPDAVETGKLENIVRGLRQYPAEKLAKHGITLAPERDWATELWADIWEARGSPVAAKDVRKGIFDDSDRKAIELLRTRFEQMIAKRSITNDQD